MTPYMDPVDEELSLADSLTIRTPRNDTVILRVFSLDRFVIGVAPGKHHPHIEVIVSATELAALGAAIEQLLSGNNRRNK